PDGRGWAYWVNGQREFIHGFGYNHVAAGETNAQRGAQYDHDFQAIAEAGANTIVGWDEQQYDELMLDKAAQQGLGVILPFDLQPSMAFEDPAERQRLIAAISRRVERYRNSPALRLWG